MKVFQKAQSLPTMFEILELLEKCYDKRFTDEIPEKYLKIIKNYCNTPFESKFFN